MNKGDFNHSSLYVLLDFALDEGEAESLGGSNSRYLLTACQPIPSPRQIYFLTVSES